MALRSFPNPAKNPPKPDFGRFRKTAGFQLRISARARDEIRYSPNRHYMKQSKQ